MCFPGFFHNNLVHGTNTELNVIKSNLLLCKNLSFGVFPFKIALIFKQIEQQIPDWSEMKGILNLFSEKLELKSFFDILDQFVNCEPTFHKNLCQETNCFHVPCDVSSKKKIPLCNS